MSTAVLLISAYVALSLLHVYWACGGRWGWNAVLPEQPTPPAPDSATARVTLFTPSRAATLGVACGLAMAALLVSLRAGLFAPPLRHWALNTILTMMAAVFLVRAIGDFHWVGFFKKAGGSTFAYLDTAIYSPLCVALGVGLLTVAYW
jgi:hypothetical protein